MFNNLSVFILAFVLQWAPISAIIEEISTRLFSIQRRWMILPERLEEVLVKLPKKLFTEMNGMAKYENIEIDDLIYQATKKYVEYKKDFCQFQETMKKGYQEMAGINLNLCSEAFLAEEEANTTLDRLVIGV